MKEGGRKSITFEEIEAGSFSIDSTHLGHVPFLDAMNKDLSQRND